MKKIAKLERSDADQAAMQLRLLARKIEAGDISYCVIYAMDGNGSIHEHVIDLLPTAPFSMAKA